MTALLSRSRLTTCEEKWSSGFNQTSGRHVNWTAHFHNELLVWKRLSTACWCLWSVMQMADNSRTSGRPSSHLLTCRVVKFTPNGCCLSICGCLSIILLSFYSLFPSFHFLVITVAVILRKAIKMHKKLLRLTCTVCSVEVVWLWSLTSGSRWTMSTMNPS